MNLNLIISFFVLTINCSAPLDPSAYENMALKNFGKARPADVRAPQPKTARRPLAPGRFPSQTGSPAFKPVVSKRKAEKETLPRAFRFAGPTPCAPWGCAANCCQKEATVVSPPYLFPNIHVPSVRRIAEEVLAQDAEFSKQQPREGDILPSFKQRFASK